VPSTAGVPASPEKLASFRQNTALEDVWMGAMDHKMSQVVRD